MLRNCIKYLSLAMVAVGLTFVSTGPATAESHSHGNSHASVGHSHANVAHGSWGHAGHGHYGGYGGYRAYYPYHYHYGSYWPYTYSYAYPYSYYYSPYTYYSYPYTYAYPSTTEAAPAAVAAQVTVRVPPSADVWFNDTLNQAGTTTRQFTTAPLAADQDAAVTVRARWTEGGSTIDRSRTIDLHAGDSVTIDFRATVNPPLSPPVPNR
jgi:uncharacterized protein (TIGR03000 family)